MSRVWLVGILVVIVGAVGVLFGGKNLYLNRPSASSGATDKAIAPNNVVINNFSFNPSTLTIMPGTTVTWTNSDSTVHSIKSSTFNSAGLNTNDTFMFTFNTPGTFNYSCGIHPSMTGTIIVQ